jgi:YVTN family beta-propeller protein
MLRTLASVLTVSFLFTAAGLAQPFAYITNSSDDTVSIIDTSTNKVVDTVEVGGEFPLAVEVTPDGQFVYVKVAPVEFPGDRHFS